MNKDFLLGIFLILMIVLLFCGCTTDNNKINENQDYDEIIDPCGNDIGNGLEIISGPLGPDFFPAQFSKSSPHRLHGYFCY